MQADDIALQLSQKSGTRFKVKRPILYKMICKRRRAYHRQRITARMIELQSEFEPERHRRLFKALSVCPEEFLNQYESSVIQERWPDSRRGHRCGRARTAARYDRSKLRYPSDLTDDEWGLVEPLIPPGKTGGGKRTVIMREVVNGLMYILSTGCQWRAIPKDLPPRSSVYDYFDLWTYDGTLERIHHALYEQCREREQREASPTAAIIDSQSVKSAEKDAMGQAARQL